MPLLRRRPHGWDETTPDEDLVEWTRRGQREAFGILYDRHHQRVYGYCYRCLGQREAAQDATGETFRKALGALERYRARSFRSWLFAIAHNVIVDEVRARRPTLPLSEAFDLPDASATPEEQAVATTEGERLHQLLTILTASQRDVMTLRLSGLTAVEIGEVLNKSRSAVDMTLQRSLQRLRAELVGEASAVSGRGGHV